MIYSHIGVQSQIRLYFYIPSTDISRKLFPCICSILPASTARRSLLTLANSLVDSWRTVISCPRWCASQSTSSSINAAVCDTVAMYFRSFVLVIASGFCIPFTSLTLAEMQSQPRRWPKEPLVALAKRYLFDLGITGGLLSINSSTTALVSGVSMIGTVLPRLPVIFIRLSLRI